MTSIFIGTHMTFFGISPPEVQVGGGLIVISTGWGLLRQPNDETDEKGIQRECNEADYFRQAFYPLTLPLTVGPGSISVVITVGANRPEGSEWRWPLIGGMLLGSLVISWSIYLSYRFSERIGRTLGDERHHPHLVVHPRLYWGPDSLERALAGGGNAKAAALCSGRSCGKPSLRSRSWTSLRYREYRGTP